MVKKAKKIHVTLDAKGGLKISGLTKGDTELKEIRKALGIPTLKAANYMYSVAQASGLDEAAVARVRQRAKTDGWEIRDVESIAGPRLSQYQTGAPVSTVETLHQHTLGPSRKEKAIIPFILIGALIVVGYAASVIWDHMSHAYRPLPELGRLPAAAAQAARKTGGGIGGLLNPDDSKYVSVEVTAWQLWAGYNAVAQNNWVRLSDIKQASIEELVKGERGSARLVFNIDLSKSQPPRYHVDRIDRAGIATENKNLTFEAIPLKVLSSPADYSMNPQIDPKDARSYRDLMRFAVTGYLEPAGDGLRFRSEKDFRITLRPPDDTGLREVMRDLTLDAGEVRILDEKKLVRGRPDIKAVKRVELYLMMEEAGVPTDPADAAARETVGRAKVTGLKIGDVFMAG